MILLFIFLLGISIGSFLNVLIDRLPQEKSITGRSWCDHCKRTLSWWELIPIVSYILQKRESRCCRKSLSLRYPLIELLTGIIFALVWFYIPEQLSTINYQIPNQLLITSYQLLITKILYLVIFSSFIVIFFADVKYHIIPDNMQLILLLSVLLLQILLNIQSNAFVTLFHYFIAGCLVMLPILILFLITRGKGMGFGDVKFAFNMGFLLGIIPGLLALYIAFILGAILGIGLLLTKQKKWKSKIAFGPFLVLSTIIIFLYGERIMEFSKRLYGL